MSLPGIPEPKPYRMTSCVRGYHRYKHLWTPVVGQKYNCKREPSNRYDTYAIAVHHDGNIVGHVPRDYSEVFSSFLDDPEVTLCCEIIAEPKYSYPDPKYGQEVPCKYEFKAGSEEKRCEIKKKIEAKQQLSRPQWAKTKNAMKNIILSGASGTMRIRRVILYGPPCVGKSSIKRLIQGYPPLDKKEQNSTGVLEPPVRLITTDRLMETGCDLKIIDEEDYIRMVGRELFKDNDNGRREIRNENAPKNAAPGISRPLNSPSSQTVQGTSSTETSNTAANRSLIDVLKQIGCSFVDQDQSIKSIYDVNWTHIIDSGGQSQFKDVLPLVFPSKKNVYLMVICLDEKLDDKPKSQFMQCGENTAESPVPLALTYLEMIKEICQIAQSSGSSVKIIGTHLDCMNSDDPDFESLEEKERRLKDEVFQEYSDVIIRDEEEKIVLAVNAIEKDEAKRLEYTNMLRKLTLLSDTLCFEKSIPLQWIILQLALSQESKEGIVPFPNVVLIANLLKINISDLNDALLFFSDLALIFHYPEVIPDLVLENIDVITFPLSKFMMKSFLKSPNCPQMREETEFKKKGLFSKSFLKNLSLGSRFTEDEFLKILKHLQIIHQVDEHEYFFPCILPIAPASIDLKPYKPHPLVLFLEDRSLPPAYFPALVVNLLNRKENLLLCDGKTKHYRNAVSFTYTSPTSPGSILLEDCTRWISLYVSNTINDFVGIRNILTRACRKVLAGRLKLSLMSSLEQGLYCPGTECNVSRPHLCSQINKSNIYIFQCLEEQTFNWKEPDDSEKLKWFQDTDTSSNQENQEPSTLDNVTERKRRSSEAIDSPPTKSPKVDSHYPKAKPHSQTKGKKISKERPPLSQIQNIVTTESTGDSVLLASSPSSSTGNPTLSTDESTDGTVRNPLLDKQPKLKDAFDLIKHRSAQWCELGRELDISLNKRTEFKTRPDLLNDDDKLEAILNRWIETNDSTATWSVLIDALEEIKLKNTAEEIERYLHKQHSSIIGRKRRSNEPTDLPGVKRLSTQNGESTKDVHTKLTQALSTYTGISELVNKLYSVDVISDQQRHDLQTLQISQADKANTVSENIREHLESKREAIVKILKEHGDPALKKIATEYFER